jgi:hypothetical protein
MLSYLNMRLHEIAVSDPMFWEAPNGTNRILAQGLGVVYGSLKFQVPKRLYLLRVAHSLVIDGEVVNQLLVNPRYVGDTLEEVISSYCIVNISRVKSNIILKSEDEFSPFDYDYWAIGSINLQAS